MSGERVQDCIIGSGAAGGVLAMRLAEAGRSVVVLEEGPEVDKRSFNQREGDMYPLLYRDGGDQMTADGGVSVLQGRCLGGSTTINMGDCVQTPPEVLAHWRQSHGWGDWGGTSDADVGAAAGRALREMGAGPIPDALVNRANRLLGEGAAKLGLAHGPLRHNRVGCTGSGYCLIGCAYDAKRGTLVTHLPPARAAGAVVRADRRVDRVRRDAGGLLVSGASRAGEAFELRAERVFVCAGAVHTPGILLRSGVRHRAIGRNLTLQPQAPIVALFPEPTGFYRGVPQSWAVHEHLSARPEEGLGGWTIEAVAAGPAMAAALMPIEASEMGGLLGRYPDLGASLCLVPDRPVGRVEWGRGPRPKIAYPLTADVGRRLMQAQREAAACYLAAGAEFVLPLIAGGPRIRKEADLRWFDETELRPADFPLISAHPQGTVRMGPGDLPVDLDFRVRGHEGLWVCDASIFPTSASTHTMVPVMAMAHLLADRLA